MKRAVITERLLELIGEREVIAAVFTTYTFEPEFFELEVIPVLLDQETAYSDDDRVKRFMVRENLRESGLPVDVYYDAPMYRQSGSGSPEMEYLCHGVSLGNAAFHAKVNLILLRDRETGDDTLLVGAGSNNLTRAGWWDNIECQHWEEVGHRTVPRRLLNLLGEDIEYLWALRELDDSRADTALERIGSFVEQCGGSNSASPVHYFGPSYSENRRQFLDFLGKGRSPIGKRDGWHLEIISPFFADNPRSTEYRNFLDMGVDDIVLLLPRDDENKALCQDEFYHHIQEQQHISWGEWQEETGRALGLTGDHFRRLHAKVYHFYDDKESWVFVGSVNFTHKALHDNVEAGFLVGQGRPQPLLQALPDEGCVDQFADLDEKVPGTEAEDETGIPALYLRYDWVSKSLTGRTAPHHAYKVQLIGPEGEPVTEPWELKYAESEYKGDVEALEKALRHGSLIKVTGCSARSRARRSFPDTTVLVQQVGWSHKPLDLPSLSATQILAIYAEMKPERRQVMLIDAKIRALVLSGERGQLLADEEDVFVEQFFCEYAEIFRAFSQLRDRLKTALDNEHFTQVDYYLTGSGVDSLPTLLEKALATDEDTVAPAPATSYLIMLSALEVLRDSQFRKRPNVPTVEKRLRKNIAVLKKGDRLTLENNSPQNRKRFFKWFEEEFFRIYTIVEEGAVKPIDLNTARCLIDYSGGDESLKRLGEIQTEGAVALQNMLADPEVGFAYLADEVGMGKTYIALGVVAMMRYFNPMLRVLYICPSKNVQEKWDREYRSFIRTNVLVGQGRIRTRDGYPAAPYKSCRNVVDLIQAATSGYYADFFIGKDSFSIALSDDEDSWEKKRDELKTLVPARDWKTAIRSKDDVKQQFARALNYILPHFDLVVIDEAHNFKHDFESSDRNKVLSRVFGFRDEEGYSPKVKRALLLSATPYDRNLNQLRNQLKMVGRAELLPETVKNEDQDRIREQLRRFMVRRLNTLNVNGKLLTRNMYRREWRDGPRAEVLLETDEQKLVTALVQKKVGELLTRQSDSPSFQTGLLASFESFADSTRSEPVEFDGDRAEKQGTDAKDRHVLAQLVENYVQSGLGRTLPHPKMDAVVRRLGDSMFDKAQKQLVFVRRVKSVGEIKAKLDDAYNEWIHGYLNEVLASYPDARSVIGEVFDAYLAASKRRDDSDIGGEVEGVDLAHDSLPAKNDTFFAWFFRGEALPEVSALLSTDGGAFPTPDGVRKGLVAKNQVVVTLMEPNWAWYLCHRENADLAKIMDKHKSDITARVGKYITGRVADDQLEEYLACQAAFVEWWIEDRGASYLVPLLESIATAGPGKSDKESAERELLDYLGQSTVYQELEVAGLAVSISPYQARLYDALRHEGDPKKATKALDQFYVHKALMSFLVRTGHGVVDLYAARLMQGPANLTATTRTQWLRDFASILAKQQEVDHFSSFQELSCVAAHLEQVIKNNIPDLFEKNREEYPTYLSQALNPVSPIIGASGETKGRSSQARKFRMPGYPLALISTDVFQEGEDLHTFCDSVVHYGLSGSPVSLEQKTGRVDRVGSMAQRRLTQLPREPEDHEYIQVTYPFVKESIESLQVRQICRNLNEFIESLHDVTAGDGAADDVVNLDEALNNKSPIPPQILKRLRSPYEPEVSETNAYNSASQVRSQERSRKAEIDHVLKLVDEELKSRGETENVTYPENRRFDISESTLGIMLRSAKASGELILSLTRKADLPPQDLSNKKLLHKLMREISWRTFHRTIAIESADTKGHHDLYYNAELLVGGEGTTSQPDIKRIFERMEAIHDPAQYSSELSPTISGYFDQISEDPKIPIDRFGATKVRSESADGENILTFDFGGSMMHRGQKVRVFECDNRCVFLSDATDWKFVGRLSAEDLVKRTWARNRRTDLVEFVVDPDKRIVGRVVHPSENMTFDEFLYCSYTLAIETDGLEYLLAEEDTH